MSTAAISRPPMSTSAPTSKRIVQKRWVCDVCKMKWFLNFEEACAHEKVCGVAEKIKPRKAAEAIVTEEKRAAKVAENKHAAKKQEVIEIADSTDSDDSPVKSTRRSKRFRTDTAEEQSTAAAAVSTAKSKPDKKNNDNATASFFKPKSKKSKPSAKKETHAHQPNKKQKGKEEAASTRNKAGAPVTKSTKTDKSGLSQQYLAEHKAASFFAKRKQAQQEERERQKKREEARKCAKKKGEDDAEKVERAEKREGYDLGVKFPRVTHVIQGEDEIKACKIAVDKCVLSYPHGKVDLIDAPEIEPMHNLSFFGDEMPTDPSPNIHRLFASVFEPSNGEKTKSSTKLWTDKHTISQIPTSILGASNRQSATKLTQFIEEWKVRRHKSTLIKKSKSKRRKSGYDSDDSFLDDECGGRTSLFVLTGPTGSGKSRLVHAISSSLDCVVMEINSNEVRGGVVLKKRVLESTQSHSSVALMKKREQGGGLLKSVGKTQKEFFDEESSSDEEEESSSLTVVLIDEVDLLFQDQGDTGFWQALSQLSQKAKSPIILTATSMPLEMLSGSFKFDHIELKRPSIEECCLKMKDVAKEEGMMLKHSDDVEFNEKLALIAEYYQCDIRRILNEMQLFRASMINSAPKSTYSNMLRRGWKAKIDCSKETENIAVDRPVILGIEPMLIPRDVHTLITIIGKNFLAAESATLYLRGNVCPYYKVVSDSKIMAVCPPLTIPDGVSKGLICRNSGPDETIKCLSSKFIDVVVSKKCSNGLVLDSSSRVWNVEYEAPIEVSLLDKEIERRAFIRKAKANRKRLQNEADEGFMSSDDEMEFELESQRLKKKVIQDSSSDDEDLNNHAQKRTEASGVTDTDPETLLSAALSDVMIEELSEHAFKTNTRNDSSTIKDLETFADETGRLSDIALLEDTLVGLPMLAGAVEGLGSQSIDGFFTDGLPLDPTIEKLSKDSHQRASFENLCLGSSTKDEFFYGSADTYMVRPCRQRERALLIKSQEHSRGIGVVDSLVGTDDKEQTDSDDEEAETSEFRMPASRAKSEDEMLLPSQPPSTSLLLKSLLGNDVMSETSSIHRSNIEEAPWVDLRIRSTWMEAVETMSSILAPNDPHSEHDWNKICFGICQSKRFNSQLQKDLFEMADNGIDTTMSLDYLPYLRMIAFHENKVYLASQKIMDDSEQSARSSRSSKRRGPSSGRSHYLASEYRNLEHVLSELGSSYLMED